MTDKPRKAWLAALASFFSLGLGHLYAGAPKRAALLGIYAIFIGMIGRVVLLTLIPMKAAAVAFVVGIVVFFWLVVADAFRLARRGRSSYELARFNRPSVYAAFAVVVFIATQIGANWSKDNLVHVFHVPSQSMAPTIIEGDRVITDMQAYVGRGMTPQRGDIVIVRDPEDQEITYLRRIAAIPGDSFSAPGAEPITVGPGHYYLTADSRQPSRDSHQWGTLPLAAIRGRAEAIVFSVQGTSINWDRAGKLLR